MLRSAVCLTIAAAAFSQLLAINSPQDIVDGDTSSFSALTAYPGKDDAISLREALLAAQGAAQPEVARAIESALPTGAVIYLERQLPIISGSEIRLQANGLLLDGRFCEGCIGLEITGALNHIEDMSILNFPDMAVHLHGHDALDNKMSRMSIGISDDTIGPNGYAAVVISGGASRNKLIDSVVSGNRGNGVVIAGSESRGNMVVGCRIGTTSDGKKAITNGFELIDGGSASYGIIVDDAPDTIIGEIPGNGNLISSYHTVALDISGASAQNVKVQGNAFELQDTVLARVPDSAVNLVISVASGAVNTLIGGNSTEEGNFIEAFADSSAIYVGPQPLLNPEVVGTWIANNIIVSTSNTGSLDFSGIILDVNALNATIGPSNQIYGFKYGIVTRRGAGPIYIHTNSIYENLKAGIYVEPLANNGMLPAAISGVPPYTSQTVPCARVEFYADEGGQGRLYLGAQYASPEGTFTLRAPEDVPSGLNVTTIVTDRNGNSSAFSAPVPVAEVERGPLDEEPVLGPCTRFYYLTADTNLDRAIGLEELLRAIQLYNSLEHHCDAATEDGYAPGPGDQTCAPHAADYNPPDWKISLSELLRLIQLYNVGGYAPCETGEDGFCPAGG